MTKKYHRVDESLGKFTASDLEGNLEERIAYLQSFIDNHPNHTDFGLDYDYGYNDHGSGKFKIMATRDETDNERDKRLAKARKERNLKAEAKEQKKTAEKKELKRLLEKYGEELIQ